MNHLIIKRLNLKEQDIESLVPLENGDCDDLVITLKKKPHICPHCHSESSLVKDYNLRKINYQIFIDSPTSLYYNARRFLCPICGKTFMEKHPFGKRRSSISGFTLTQVLKALKPFNSTFSSVARQYHLSVSKVIDLFDAHVQISRKSIPKIMCWDEFYFNRHAKYKYAFIMMDFRNKLIIDILESRRIHFLCDYFFTIHKQERRNAQYIIIDMYQPYREIAQTYFPQAKVVVDPFHVIKMLNTIINTIRKNIMSHHDKKRLEYRLLKYRYKLLLKDWQDIDRTRYHFDSILHYHITEEETLNLLLDISPYLKNAYYLVQDYYDFNRENEKTCPDRMAKEEQLNQIIQSFISSGYKNMIHAAHTLSNWKEEILNSFTWCQGRRLSNGPIEGKNNYIKKILSNANGFQNFERARNKILYSQNQYESYSITEHDKPIKKRGNKRGSYTKKTKKI